LLQETPSPPFSRSRIDLTSPTVHSEELFRSASPLAIVLRRRSRPYMHIGHLTDDRIDGSTRRGHNGFRRALEGKTPDRPPLRHRKSPRTTHRPVGWCQEPPSGAPFAARPAIATASRAGRVQAAVGAAKRAERSGAPGRGRARCDDGFRRARLREIDSTARSATKHRRTASYLASLAGRCQEPPSGAPFAARPAVAKARNGGRVRAAEGAAERAEREARRAWTRPSTVRRWS